IVTHHITAILLTGFLIVWALVTLLPRAMPVVRRLLPGGHSQTSGTHAGDADDLAIQHSDFGRLSSPGLVGPALIALIATFAWMLYVASVTVGYLAPALGGAMDQILGLIAGEEAGRELFRAASGTTSPASEQVAAFASVAVLLAAMALGGL